MTDSGMTSDSLGNQEQEETAQNVSDAGAPATQPSVEFTHDPAATTSAMEGDELTPAREATVTPDPSGTVHGGEMPEESPAPLSQPDAPLSTAASAGLPDIAAEESTGNDSSQSSTTPTPAEGESPSSESEGADGDAAGDAHARGSRQRLFPKLSDEEMKRLWTELAACKNSGQEVEIEVVATNRGGIVASYHGIEVFVPVSHWTLDRHSAAAISAVQPGDKVAAHILEITAFETDARRVTATRRTLLRRELLSTIEPGARLTGRVVSVLDFGVFVNVGGIDGLLPASEMSHDRASRPVDLFHKGQEVEVVVKEVDRDRRRVYLSRKELLPSPWEGVEDRFPIGSTQRGKVVGIGKDGAFVQLEPGIDGFLRAGELSWTRRVASPRDVLQKGQDLDVKVLDVSARRQRISLSYRQAHEDPWPSLVQVYGVGSSWEGTATAISNKGVVVAVGDVEGFLPRSRMGRESRRLPEMKTGEKIQVSVLEIDPANHSLIFGLPNVELEGGGGGEGRGRRQGGAGRPERRGDDRGRQPAVQPSNEIKSSETVTSFALGDLITDAIKARLSYGEGDPAATKLPTQTGVTSDASPVPHDTIQSQPSVEAVAGGVRMEYEGPHADQSFETPETAQSMTTGGSDVQTDTEEERAPTPPAVVDPPAGDTVA